MPLLASLQDGDGFLDLRELKRAFRAIGLEKRKGEKFELDQKTFDSFDTNKDGKVSLQEFEENLHAKTRAAIVAKLNDGWVFDAALWAASAERHAGDAPYDAAQASADGQIPADPAPEVAAEPEAPKEPVDPAEAEAAADPAVAAAVPEAIAEPEAAAEPEPPPEPTVEAEPEAPAEPEMPAE